MFHDRRVPGDDAWGTQALGNYPVWEGSEALAKKLGFEMGKVTTGSSLDMQPCDEKIIHENGGQLKDMEEDRGKQLFIRGSKKIERTDEGRILKKRAASCCICSARAAPFLSSQ